MHELSICQSMLKQVCDVARQYHAPHVHSVRIQLGPLSGIEADLLKQVFPIASSGTLADGAELLIQTMPVRVLCKHCNAAFDVQINQLGCPVCGDTHTQLVSGDEMILDSVQLAGHH
ncbi:MAG: hydrogenase maturation nickel metallochaperone HypA [Gammaproteobacteria bacterium]|nr:hydrogenase maturation nickel metallochaperone HypA [Gammaproteobacteria bacterium]